MKAIVKSAVMLLFLSLCVTAPGGAAESGSGTRTAKKSSGGIQWVSYDESMERGKQEDKKIFLNFYADWCQYCKVMDQNTFKNKEVIAYLNENFIPVRVNTDKQQKLAARYSVQNLPVTWFISPDGENIGSQPGYIPPDMMIPLLKYIDTDRYQDMNFNTFLEKNK